LLQAQDFKRRYAGNIEMPRQIGAGIILIVIGIAMITGHLTTFSYWLLLNFSVFA
jgi:hypothetical protein